MENKTNKLGHKVYIIDADGTCNCIKARSLRRKNRESLYMVFNYDEDAVNIYGHETISVTQLNIMCETLADRKFELKGVCNDGSLLAVKTQGGEDTMLSHVQKSITEAGKELAEKLKEIRNFTDSVNNKKEKEKEEMDTIKPDSDRYMVIIYRDGSTKRTIWNSAFTAMRNMYVVYEGDIVNVFLPRTTYTKEQLNSLHAMFPIESYTYSRNATGPVYRITKNIGNELAETLNDIRKFTNSTDNKKEE